MAVEARWRTVSGPSGVRNTGVIVEDLAKVRLLRGNQLLELCDLADLFEREDLSLLIAVDGQTSGVIASVF